MKYRNASEILPDGLLKELQKYASGEVIYVPSNRGRRRWGEGTGASHFYERSAASIAFRKKPYAEYCTAETAGRGGDLLRLRRLYRAGALWYNVRGTRPVREDPAGGAEGHRKENLR